MKKFLSILFALTLTLPVAAFAQGTLKIGTVDMQRAFKDYNKTKEAEAKINDAKNSAKKEYDDRAEAYKNRRLVHKEGACSPCGAAAKGRAFPSGGY